jgi:hypothetical protein
MSLLSTLYKILSNIQPLKVKSVHRLGIISVGFDITSTTDHIFCICQILEKKWEYNEAVHQLFIYLKKAYDSILYNILIEFGVLMKVVRLIKMCLILSTHQRLGVPSRLFPFAFLYAFLFPPFMLHALPISSSLI